MNKNKMMYIQLIGLILIGLIGCKPINNEIVAKERIGQASVYRSSDTDLLQEYYPEYGESHKDTSYSYDRPFNSIEDQELVDKQFHGLAIGDIKINTVIVGPGQESGDISIKIGGQYHYDQLSIIMMNENRDILLNQVMVPMPEDPSDPRTPYNYQVIFNQSDIDLRDSQTLKYVFANKAQYSEIYDLNLRDGESSETMAFFGDIQGYKLSQYQKFADIVRGYNTSFGQADYYYLAGDLVDDGGNYDQWDFFFDTLGQDLSQHQWLATIGNHDVKNSHKNIKKYFMPFDFESKAYKRYYSFETKYAQFAVIDTESVASFQEQMAWLEETFKTDKHKVVLMHRSVYPMSYDESHIRRYKDYFQAYGVDLVLSGHDHIYSRTTMADDHRVEPKEGPTYVVGGSASGSKYYSGKYVDKRPWKHIIYDDDNPVVSQVVFLRGKILFKAYGYSDDNFVLVDEFTIKKEGQ